MEVDDLYLDVFLPHQMFQRRENDHGSHANKDIGKYDIHRTRSAEKRVEGHQKTPLADESSLDIYGDLSMDTICLEDPEHSPSKQEINLRKCLRSLSPPVPKENPCAKAPEVNIGWSENLETFDKLLTELQDKVSELQKENRQLKQCKEQLKINISSLCIAGRKIIKKKDDEISELRQNRNKQQTASTYAQTEAHLASKHVQTEMLQASKYMQTVYHLATKSVQTVDSLQYHDSPAYLSKLNLQENNMMSNCSGKGSKWNAEMNCEGNITSASADQLCLSRSIGISGIGDRYEEKEKESDGTYEPSDFRTSPEAYVYACDLRNRLKRKREHGEKREHVSRIQIDAKDRNNSPLMNVHGSVLCKQQKLVSSQSKRRRKALSSENWSLMTSEKKHHSEIRDRLQREISLSIPLAECEGVASRKRSKAVSNGRHCEIDNGDRVSYLKSKCCHGIGIEKLPTASSKQDRMSVDASTIQGKGTSHHGCSIKGLNPTCKQDITKDYWHQSLATHCKELSSDSQLHNKTPQITESVPGQNSKKSHENSLPAMSRHISETAKILEVTKTRNDSFNGISCNSTQEAGSKKTSNAVNDNFFGDAGLPIALNTDASSDENIINTSSLLQGSMVKTLTNVCHHKCHEENLISQVQSNRTQSAKTNESLLDSSENRDHITVDSDSSRKLNFAADMHNTDCDRNSNCNLKMVTNKDILKTPYCCQDSIFDAVFTANNAEQEYSDSVDGHAHPEQITHITCTPNLILLGDEETSFGSPNKSQHFPTEFYPPGVRGKVYDQGSHQRHIRGLPEVLCKEMVSKELTFHSHFDKEEIQFDEISANGDSGKRQYDRESANSDCIKWKQTNDAPIDETHKVGSETNISSSKKEYHKEQVGPIFNCTQREDRSNSISSVSASGHNINLFEVENEDAQSSGKYWMSAVEKIFKKTFDKDMLSFKTERAEHMESKALLRLKKAKIMKELKASRIVGYSKMNVLSEPNKKARKLSSTNSISPISSPILSVQKTVISKKCSISPRRCNVMSDAKYIKKDVSMRMSNNNHCSERIGLKQVKDGVERKSVQEGNQGKTLMELSPDSSIVTWSEHSNRDTNSSSTSTFANDESEQNPVQCEPVSTCNDQAKADQSSQLNSTETCEQDRETNKTQTMDYQSHIPAVTDLDEISVGDASLSEFDNDVVGIKMISSSSSGLNLVSEQDTEVKDSVVKEKCRTLLSKLRRVIASDNFESDKTLPEEVVTMHSVVKPSTSEKEEECLCTHMQHPKVTEYSSLTLSRHMTWQQVQLLKNVRKSPNNRWTITTDNFQAVKQIKHAKNPLAEKHSVTENYDAASPNEQKFATSCLPQNVGLKFGPDICIEHSQHCLDRIGIPTQLKLGKQAIASAETSSEIKTVSLKNKILKSASIDEISDVEEGEIQDDSFVSNDGCLRNDMVHGGDLNGIQEQTRTFYDVETSETSATVPKAVQDRPSSLALRIGDKGSFEEKQKREPSSKTAKQSCHVNGKCDEWLDSSKTWTSRFSTKISEDKKMQRSPPLETVPSVKLMKSQNTIVNEIFQKHDARHAYKQRHEVMGYRNERKQGGRKGERFDDWKFNKRYMDKRSRTKSEVRHRCRREEDNNRDKRDLHTKARDVSSRSRASERLHLVDHEQTSEMSRKHKLGTGTKSTSGNQNDDYTRHKELNTNFECDLKYRQGLGDRKPRIEVHQKTQRPQLNSVIKSSESKSSSREEYYKSKLRHRK